MLPYGVSHDIELAQVLAHIRLSLPPSDPFSLVKMHRALQDKPWREALQQAGYFPSEKHLQVLVQHFGQAGGTLDHQALVRQLRDPLSQTRQQVLDQLVAKVDCAGCGMLNTQILWKDFRGDWAQLQRHLPQEQIIPTDSLLDYYLDLSQCVVSDSVFVDRLVHDWALSVPLVADQQQVRQVIQQMKRKLLGPPTLRTYIQQLHLGHPALISPPLLNELLLHMGIPLSKATLHALFSLLDPAATGSISPSHLSHFLLHSQYC